MFGLLCDFCDFFVVVFFLICSFKVQDLDGWNLYLPRRDPQVAPSCLQERPNVTGIKQVNAQSRHTHTHKLSPKSKLLLLACALIVMFSAIGRGCGKICFLAVRWADHSDEWVLKEGLLLWHFFKFQTAPLLIGHPLDLKPPSRQADRSEKHASNSGQQDVKVMAAKGLPSCLRAWSWGCWCCWRPWPPWSRGIVTGGNTGGAPACVNTLQRKAGEDS